MKEIAKVLLTSMIVDTKTRYMKKSPGFEKREAVVSRLEAYVKMKYGSSTMPNFGPEMRKLVAMRHT
jgi:hypothetical protein